MLNYQRVYTVEISLSCQGFTEAIPAVLGEVIMAAPSPLSQPAAGWKSTATVPRHGLVQFKQEKN